MTEPLIALFNELREVPQMASPRIQRWAVTLGGGMSTQLCIERAVSMVSMMVEPSAAV